MNFNQGVKMAFASILSNKLRSFLTILGIIIGVTAVIALVSIGQGTTNQVTAQVSELGTNLLTVNITARDVHKPFTHEDAQAFDELDGIRQTAPAITQNATVKRGTDSTEVNVVGTTPSYADVRDFHVQRGRFLLPIDIQYSQKVALLGTETADQLFGTNQPVGESIQIDGSRFTVVGLLEEKGSGFGGSNDDIVLIPVTAAERLFYAKNVSTVYVTAESENELDTAQQEIETVLDRHFRNRENLYRVMNQQQILDTVSSITGTLTLALGGIAGISLLVGGIGIMNIMLVSVTERTREIGIRKAIGARKKDILLQFMIESIVLSGLGGIAGIVLGSAGAIGVAGMIGIDAVISAQVVLIAFAFSAMIGILFGIFPANKAANLSPIAALRSE